MADARVLGARAERRRGSSPLSCILPIHPTPLTDMKSLLAPLTLLLLTASAAHADSIRVVSGSGGGGALELAGVRILRIESGRLFFRSAGAESSRDLAQIQRIALDDEPALNTAEAAFVAADYDAAIDEYLRVARSTAKPWLRQWASLRLMTAAQRAGRFDAAVSAYVQLVQQDAAFAQEHRPTLDPASPPRPGILDAGASEIDRTLERNRQLTPDQRRALLQLQLDIQRARNDTARTAKTLEDLLALGGGGAPGSAPGGGEVPARALADLRLSAAAVALDAGDHRHATELLNQSRPLFTDPRQQSEALFLLAQAADAASANSRDRPTRQDVALAYLRVVAHFRGVPGSDRRVPAAALRAAAILEELGDRAEARALYRDLAEARIAPTDGPTDPATLDAARRGIERLR